MAEFFPVVEGAIYHPMSANTRMLGSLEIHLEKPTELTFSDLQDWVLWQFPRAQGGWLCGAAHAGDPDSGWIPARIQPLKKRVLLYGQCTELYSSPEDAADWVAKLQD